MATALPATSAFNGASVDEANFKARFAEMRAYLAGLLGVSGELSDARKQLGVAGNEVVNKTANYTLLPEDCGKTFVWSGSTARTAAFAAAATLGNGWTAEFVNKMSANLTLDPDIAELIDGITTYVVPPGGRAILRCDGVGLILVAKVDNSVVTSFNGRQGAVTLTSGDVTTALGFTPSPNTHTHAYVPQNVGGGVGSFTQLIFSGAVGGSGISVGTTFSGSNVKWPVIDSVVGYGSWSIQQQINAAGDGTGLSIFQRIG